MPAEPSRTSAYCASYDAFRGFREILLRSESFSGPVLSCLTRVLSDVLEVYLASVRLSRCSKRSCLSPDGMLPELPAAPFFFRASYDAL